MHCNMTTEKISNCAPSSHVVHGGFKNQCTYVPFENPCLENLEINNFVTVILIFS